MRFTNQSTFVPVVVILSFSLGFVFHNTINKDWGIGRQSVDTHRRGDTTTSVATDGDWKQKSSVVLASNEQINNAPLFVLHVGPRETGGSAIQYYASRYRSSLEEDNFYYLGNWKEQKPESKLQGLYKTCFMAKGEMAEDDCERRWQDLQDEVDEHYEQNHNIFVSDEMFSAFHDEADAELHLWKFLAPMLKKWRVKIVYSHRHYFAWLHSKYVQLYNPQKQGKRELWVDLGGRDTPTFSAYMSIFMSDKTHKNPQALRKRWEKRFPKSVQVFNIHENDDDGKNLVANFFCQMVPEASNTCKHASISPDDEATAFPQPLPDRIHFDMLALEAYQRGWISKDMSRTAAIDAVESFSTEMGMSSVTDFPAAICLRPKERKSLFDASLATEKEMLPPESFSSQRGVAQLRAAFNNATNDGMFCSVNADKTFQKDGRWRRFFQGLNSGDSELKLPVLEDIPVNHYTDATQIKPVSDTTKDSPSKLLCLYVGDEGSTVLSEAMRSHPHIYSPDWKLEPVNPRNWDAEDFSLEKQLDSIRFLLRMKSNVTEFQKNPRSSIDKATYVKKVGHAGATYLKARVCKNEKNKTRTWSDCIGEVVDNLVCGEPDDTIDHLILPVRYGFDRICSKFVHQHKSLYKQLSQFHGDNGSKTKNVTESFTKNDAERLVTDQQDYLEEFLETIHVAQTRCPDQSKKTKIHVFDYDRAKRVGLTRALGELFQDIGLRNKKTDLDLGEFADRKPSNYCEKIFDEESKQVLSKAELDYENWLQSTCEGDGRHYPWCDTNDDDTIN